MPNHTYLSIQELIHLTDEILTKTTRAREIIEEEAVGLKSLGRPAEDLYKEALNFKYKVYEVPIDGKGLS